MGHRPSTWYVDLKENYPSIFDEFVKAVFPTGYGKIRGKMFRKMLTSPPPQKLFTFVKQFILIFKEIPQIRGKLETLVNIGYICNLMVKLWLKMHLKHIEKGRSDQWKKKHNRLRNWTNCVFLKLLFRSSPMGWPKRRFT